MTNNKNKKIIEAWNKIEPDSAADERMLSAILARKRKELVMQKRTHWKILAPVAAFSLLAALVIPNLLKSPVNQLGNETSIEETTMPPPAQNTAPPAQNMTVNINKLNAEPRINTNMFCILEDNIEHLTLDELYEHFRIQPFDIADVIYETELVYGGFWGGEYGIYHFPDGSLFDMNSFQYHRKNTSQHISIIIESGNPLIAALAEAYENPLKKSEIVGVEMVLANYSTESGFARSDDDVWVAPGSDMYFAQFTYKELSIVVETANLSEEEFIAVLDYIIATV